MMSSLSEDENPSEGEKRLGTVSGEASAGGGRGGFCRQGNVLLLHDQERGPARVQEVRHVGGYRLRLGRGEGGAHRRRVIEPVLGDGVVGRRRLVRVRKHPVQNQPP